ncbi:hypothetical protein EVAR_14057_1 [Eumeta japonica]|uniref:Uncharacterized protein n=1 Tax=Eumeta variegata TaxID=151549 RepID=A0A4C1UNF7_EUMVA|nr:hypothetical protein EVAR_14057_1 [Eumeta japonica]
MLKIALRGFSGPRRGSGLKRGFVSSRAIALGVGRFGLLTNSSVTRNYLHLQNKCGAISAGAARFVVATRAIVLLPRTRRGTNRVCDVGKWPQNKQEWLGTIKYVNNNLPVRSKRRASANSTPTLTQGFRTRHI